MVNILKRMRKLDEKLLRIRYGAGAAKLSAPTTQIPFITRIHLTHPYGPGTFIPRYHGSRLFWRTHLPRLKYWNPALPITVTHESTAPKDETKKPKNPALEEEVVVKKEKVPDSNVEATLTVYFDDGITKLDEGKNYEDYIPSQGAPADASAQQIAKETRSASLDTRGKSANQIWAWLKQTINAVDVEIPEEDQTRRNELALFKKKAEEDRAKVKKGMDAKRAHDAMLRRARGEAEKMRNEV